MEQILIVEDDRALNQGLCKALQTDDRQVNSRYDLQGAREFLKNQTVNLIILDLNLPDGNGLELLDQVRKQFPELAVILLTANDTDEDVVKGLEQGADDYITKPFSLAILRARVNTQLRRVKAEKDTAAIEIGPYSFDFNTLRFCVNGSLVELSKTEQKLLRLLVENRGRPMERSVLVDRIWTDGADFVDENALSVAVKRLRDKLGAQDRIKTIYGIGYSWVNKDD